MRRPLFRHVGALRNLELHGVNVPRGLAEVAGDVTAFEATVHNMRETLLRAQSFNHPCHEPGCRAVATVGAQIQLRQFTLEQARRMRPDRMGIPDQAASVCRQDPIPFRGEGPVIGSPVTIDASGNLAVRKLPTGCIDRLAFECLGGAHS